MFIIENQNNFYEENGEKLKFHTEEAAIEFVNKTFKRKHIHEDYRTAKSVFDEMKIT